MPAKLRRRAAPSTIVSPAVILALAVAAVIAFSGSPALAANVSCGDTITTDTTLHKNLVDCPNNGLLIGADGITLNLNGHTIDGDGTPAVGCDPQTDFCDVGVANFGYDGVTVVHGSLRQFAGGVDFGDVRHNRLLDISASNNQVIGIQLFSASRSLIRNSSGTGSTDPDDGAGLGLFDSHRVRILDNSFRRNGARGVAVHDSTHNLIEGNLLARTNGSGGIRLEGSDRNHVRGNRSVRDREGILVTADSSRNVIARNRVFRSGRHGQGAGIKIGEGRGNLIVRNLIARGAPEDGVHVNRKAKHTLLKRNHAFGAKDDGLDVNNSTTKLTRNDASRNHDLGIEAVPGVIDGGGNRASGNGDPRQCTHIVCG